MKLKGKIRLSVWQYLALGYFFVILIGSVLLVLPFAAADGSSHSYLDALFTATSATCVTGLVPFDTATGWSLFGQIVILLLIQLGGLGFTTFVSILFMMVRGGLGVYERKVMMQSVGGKYDGVRKLVIRIVVATFVLETAGALLLMIRFIPDFGAGKGIYFSIFHAVSAFCNAGFDLMGVAAGTDVSVSLSRYATDPLVVLVICVLIIVGGLGFVLWGDVFDCRGNPKKFSFYTRLILVVNTCLVAISMALFLLFERENFAAAGYNFGESLLVALFDATTPRTAGFFTTDPALLSDSGYLLTVILMFIGGSSGSTAGGIKVGTFAVLVVGMFAVLRGRRDIDIGKRRIENSAFAQALAIFTAYLMLVLVATMLICAIETDAGFANVLFTSVSALGTVGLSRMSFGIASKIIYILLMYAGRVGVVTLALALGRKKTLSEIRKPAETVFIG